VDPDPGFEIFPNPRLDFSKNYCSLHEKVKKELGIQIKMHIRIGSRSSKTADPDPGTQKMRIRIRKPWKRVGAICRLLPGVWSLATAGPGPNIEVVSLE